jgi:hypothetical protein
MKLQVTLTNGTVTKAYKAPIVLYYVGHAGELHVNCSNGASIRNDETLSGSDGCPGPVGDGRDYRATGQAAAAQRVARSAGGRRTGGC